MALSGGFRASQSRGNSATCVARQRGARLEIFVSLFSPSSPLAPAPVSDSVFAPIVGSIYLRQARRHLMRHQDAPPSLGSMAHLDGKFSTGGAIDANAACRGRQTDRDSAQNGRGVPCSPQFSLRPGVRDGQKHSPTMKYTSDNDRANSRWHHQERGQRFNEERILNHYAE